MKDLLNNLNKYERLMNVLHYGDKFIYVWWDQRGMK
jgi:hypothetical protein